MTRPRLWTRQEAGTDDDVEVGSGECFPPARRLRLLVRLDVLSLGPAHTPLTTLHEPQRWGPQALIRVSALRTIRACPLLAGTTTGKHGMRALLTTPHESGRVALEAGL